jgi:DNA modification methylase
MIEAGNSLLFQGDCLTVLPQLPAGSVDMVFADLPYGVTANKWDTVIPFGPLWAELLRVGKRNCAYVFTATQPFATALINSQPKLFRYDLVWDKTRAASFAYANHRPLASHESVLVFAHQGTVYNPQKTTGHAPVKSRTSYVKSSNGGPMPIGKPSDDTRFPLSILPVKREDMRNKNGHPTQKPVALLEWLVKTYSNPGDVVLDPTMGSGTTGVACANTGRVFVGVEKDASYFDVACKRIAEASAEVAS